MNTEQLNKRLPEVISSVPKEQLLQLPYFQNRGMFFLERAFVKDELGIAERVFSDTIKKYHENSHGGSFLDSVCETEGELRVAFSVFQWLTTNVGSSVLEGAKKNSKAAGGR